jgi:cytochrome c biogenesis factor
MFSPDVTALALESAKGTLASLGMYLDVLILLACAAVLVALVVPTLRSRLRPMLAALLGTLLLGEAALIWFHVRLWQLCQLADPTTGLVTGGFAVPIWVESEKLYIWALIVTALALGVKRHGTELRPMLAVGAIGLAAGAVLLGRPFMEPLPDFFAQYNAFLSAWRSGDINMAYSAFRGAEASRLYYYNAWYMWVHPPLLFFSYGAFVVSFAATVLMVARRRSSFEQTAYRWARLGYLPLTLGMVVGMPWAIIAWAGDAWWWSGKVNMSIMMWVLYTAYLHSRLYLRRRGMWKVVAALAILSFVALVLTYITTYIVPGAHSVA